MIRVAVAGGALVWGLVVFEATRWLTFPSDAVGAWITYELATRMPGSTAEIGSVTIGKIERKGRSQRRVYLHLAGA